MSSLFGSMSIALQSLLTQQGALGVVANNIANANTPGSSREVAVLEENAPIFLGNVLVGTGVSMEKVESVRDNVLNLRIQQETSQQFSLGSYLDSMNQVEAVFNETQGVGLQSSLSDFFNSFTALAADPTNSSLRQAVITAGQDLADEFNQTSQSLSTIQQGLDQSVVQTVDQVNQLTSQIANLDQQIQAVSSSAQDPGGLEDQRDTALKSLSQLVDVSVVTSEDGTLSVTTTNGTLLVQGDQSESLSVQTNAATGMHDVISQGTDITAAITGGELKGYIQARDTDIPSIQSSLDDLAASLTNSVNQQQAKGTDLTGATGTDFFTPFTSVVSGSNTSAAASMSVTLTKPDEVAASSDGTTGSGGNATALADLQNQTIISGETPANYYANLVSQIGNSVSNATSQQEAVKLVLQQLDNQQSAVSGVSLDEEASNLILYQRAYEASARVMSVVDQLTSDTISMVSSA